MSAPINDTTATDCLLVVDDQESNIQLIGSMLGKLGFEILPASNGEQALKRISARQPDLILLDLMMPGMDGFEICRQIQNHPEWCKIPIIFLSAEDDKNLVVRALESGGVDFITKPLNKAELISRVRTHLMLRSTRMHLERLAQDKEELIGIISHHLQNHLAGMCISAQMLYDRTKDSPDPKIALMSENIVNSSSQMRSFVKAFLANSAADHGMNVRLENLNLEDATNQIIKQYQPSARAKSITIKTDFPKDPIWIKTDPTAFNQILDNLVSNAIKFSHPNKSIHISLRHHNHYGECSVRDEGPGITESDRHRMFNRYARLSARPTGGEPSTGLGLSIAKKLAKAVGGDLTCDNASEGGAVFTVKAPLMETIGRK